MKESISYTFLLNIIITFIFICFAVIMGIFSYYRAFRANTAILNSIEKYEGFNCLSQEEAAKSLANIGYSTPFRANRKTDNKGTLLTNDDTIYGNLGYSVVSYDVGEPVISNADDSPKKFYRQYQYGVFTYMYIDLPVVNQMLRIPVFGKSSVLYEFRRLYYKNLEGNVHSTDNKWDVRIDITGNKDALETTSIIQEIIIKQLTADLGIKITKISNIKSRVLYVFDSNGDGLIQADDAMDPFIKHSNRECGIFIDYSAY